MSDLPVSSLPRLDEDHTNPNIQSEIDNDTKQDYSSAKDVAATTSNQQQSHGPLFPPPKPKSVRTTAPATRGRNDDASSSRYGAFVELFDSDRQTLNTYYTARSKFSFRSLLSSLMTDSTGKQSQNGATWRHAFNLTMNSGFGSAALRSTGHKGVREGREREVREKGRFFGVGRTGKEPAPVPISMLEALGVAPVFEDVQMAQKRCWAVLFTGIRRVEEMILEWECAEATSKCSLELSRIKKRLDLLFLELDRSVIFESNGLQQKPKLKFSWDQFQGYHTTMIQILIDLDDMRSQIPGMLDWARCYDEEMTSGMQSSVDDSGCALDDKGQKTETMDMAFVDYAKFGRHVLPLKRTVTEVRTIVAASKCKSPHPMTTFELAFDYASDAHKEIEGCLDELQPDTPQGSILYWLLTSHSWRSATDLLNKEFLIGIVEDWQKVVVKMPEVASIFEVDQQSGIQQQGMVAAGYDYTRPAAS